MGNLRKRQPHGRIFSALKVDLLDQREGRDHVLADL